MSKDRPLHRVLHPQGWRAPAMSLERVGCRMGPAAPFGPCLASHGKMQAGRPSIAALCRGSWCPVQEGASGHHRRDITGGISLDPLSPPRRRHFPDPVSWP